MVRLRSKSCRENREGYSSRQPLGQVPSRRVWGQRPGQLLPVFLHKLEKTFLANACSEDKKKRVTHRWISFPTNASTEKPVIFRLSTELCTLSTENREDFPHCSDELPQKRCGQKSGLCYYKHPSVSINILSRRTWIFSKYSVSCFRSWVKYKITRSV